MKKLFMFFVILLSLTGSFQTASAAVQGEEVKIKDDYTDMNFVLPEGWKKESFESTDDITQYEFGNNKNDMLIFGYIDVWAAVPENERQGYTRNDFNISVLTKDDIKEIFTQMSQNISSQFKGYNVKTTTSDVVKEMVNSTEYYKINGTISATLGGKKISKFMEYYIYCNKGILYMFFYGGDESSSGYKDYKALLQSVRFNNLATAAPVETYNSVRTYDDPVGSWFAISLLFTVSVYTLPIIVYRFLILKKPMPKTKANKVVIIYGICAFIAGCIIGSLIGDYKPGIAILFWSYVNKRILTFGYVPEASDTQAAANDSAA